MVHFIIANVGMHYFLSPIDDGSRRFTLRIGLWFLTSQMTRSWCESDSKALDRKEYYQERRLKELQLDLPWEARIKP